MKNFIPMLYKKTFSESFLLIFFGILALCMANIAGGVYQKIINFPVFSLICENSKITISRVINDGFMVSFFLLIGLEIKYELVKGELRSFSHAMLPIIAAFGGMAMPALVYKLVTYNNSNLHVGWAIPIATDIGFAVGILSFFKENPKFRKLRIFLTTLAIVDDLGAVIAILLFYSKELFNMVYVIPILLTIVILILVNLFKIRNYMLYLLIGSILWGIMFFSEIHPTLSGIIIGLVIPINSYYKDLSIKLFIKKFLYPFVSYFVLPLFSFINAGVNFTGFKESSFFNSFNDLSLLLPIGIFFGLFVGKPLGILLFVKIFLKLRFVKLLEGISFRDIQSVSVLCGIGFTMSIFITNLAFDPIIHHKFSELSKIGIISSSIFSAIFGYFFLRRFVFK